MHAPAVRAVSKFPLRYMILTWSWTTSGTAVVVALVALSAGVVTHVWLHATGHRPRSHSPPQCPPRENAAQSLPVSTHTAAPVVPVVGAGGVAGSVVVLSATASSHCSHVSLHSPTSHWLPHHCLIAAQSPRVSTQVLLPVLAIVLVLVSATEGVVVVAGEVSVVVAAAASSHCPHVSLHSPASHWLPHHCLIAAQSPRTSTQVLLPVFVAGVLELAAVGVAGVLVVAVVMAVVVVVSATEAVRVATRRGSEVVAVPEPPQCPHVSLHSPTSHWLPHHCLIVAQSPRASSHTVVVTLAAGAGTVVVRAPVAPAAVVALVALEAPVAGSARGPWSPTHVPHVLAQSPLSYTVPHHNLIDAQLSSVSAHTGAGEAVGAVVGAVVAVVLSAVPSSMAGH